MFFLTYFGGDVLPPALICAIICLLLALSLKRKGAIPFQKDRHPTSRELTVLYNRPSIFVVAYIFSFVMQLSHPEKGRIFRAHTTMEYSKGGKRTARETRRLVRTFAFGALWQVSSADEQRLLAVWLDNIHHGMSAYSEESQVFVLAALAWALLKCHRLVGSVSEADLDTAVQGTMSMLNFLHEDKPKGQRIKPPSTAKELETYIQEQGFDADGMEALLAQFQSSKLFQFTLVQQSLFRQMLQDSSVFAKGRAKDASWFTEAVDFVRLLPLRVSQPFFSMFHDTLWPCSYTTKGFIEKTFFSSGSLYPQERQYFAEVMEEAFGKDKIPNVDNTKPRSRRSLREQVCSSLALAKKACSVLLEPPKCSYYRNDLKGCEREGTLVQHLGIIMDGNRRAATQRKQRVGKGHQMGSTKLQDCIVWGIACGLKNLTVWAFSKDNFQRPPEELSDLYDALREGFVKLANSNTISAQGVRIHVIGDLDGFPADVRAAMDYSMESTKDNTGFNFVVAAGYGGQDEIAHTAKLCQASNQELSAENIQKHTYPARLGLPPVDSILRTSGEKRLSGFMLWDSQYAELVFLKENWPDVTESIFYKHVLELSKRKRRFGK